jgi:hypothetical protein
VSTTTAGNGNDGMTSRYVFVIVVWVAVLSALYALQEYFS